jgi:hypothetical protein
MSSGHDVGFGRPPKRTRLKKGPSGNRGRRKQRRLVTNAELLDELLLAPVDITENESRRRVTRLMRITGSVDASTVSALIKALAKPKRRR